MIFRLSHKLNLRIKAGPMPAAPPDDNPYADWSARLFTADRTPYVLLTNTRSLYSTVLFARGCTAGPTFIERALSNLRDFLTDDGMPFIYHQFIAPATQTVAFRKPLNRSVTGSMNELELYARDFLASGDVAPSHVGFALNNLLLSAAARDRAESFATPRQAFKRLGIPSENAAEPPPAGIPGEPGEPGNPGEPAEERP